MELVFVNINKLICKLVEGLRFFKAEYNSILDGQKRTKNGPKMVYYGVKMIKNVHNRLKETKTRLEMIQFRVTGSKKTIRQVSRSDPPYQLVDMVMIIIVFSSVYHECPTLDNSVFRAKLVTLTVYQHLNSLLGKMRKPFG